MWCCNRRAIRQADDRTELEGYARATGGDRVVTVSTQEEFFNTLKPGNRVIVKPGPAVGWNIGTVQLPDNYTLDAPGLNLVIKGSLRPGSNNILRRFRIADAPVDLIWIDPQTRTDIWIDQVSFKHPADGALDVASSKLNDDAGECRISVTNCEFVGINKVSVLDSLQHYLASPKIFATFKGNFFNGCGQRQPRVGPNAVVHSYENRHFIQSVDGGGMTGIAVFGGTVLSEREEFWGGGKAIRFYSGKLTTRDNNYNGLPADTGEA